MQKKSLVQRMENKFGKYAIKHLIIYVIIAYIIGYIFVFANADIYNALVLDASMVMQGQVWRLFTWICTVPSTFSVLTIFVLLFYYFIGRSLEQTLGAFKYNLFMFAGWFFMTLGAMVVYWVTTGIYGAGMGMVLPVSTYYLNLASFLAFALLSPDTQVLLFFIIPLKMKWLAFLDIAYLIYQIVTYAIYISQINNLLSSGQITDEVAYYSNSSYWAQIFSIIISLLNFIIFFLMVRKVTPNNVKEKMKAKAEQKKRQEEWRQNWSDNRQQWHDNGWTNGETRWNEKGGQEEKKNPMDIDKDQHEQFMGWADWYDPNESEEERTERRNEYLAEQQRKEAEKEEKRARKRQEKADRAMEKKQNKTSVYGAQVFEHRCDICGRTNQTNPELVFRYCSNCNGNHEFCEDHIFNHEHFKE